MKNGSMTKNPIMGGSNGLPALKNEKKNVIIKNTERILYSLKYLM
jgi:hypothetical protein